MAVIIARRLEWDMGHRVYQHEGKCRYPHGHRYACDIHLTGELDPLGRVVDFGDVKTQLGNWIDRNLDHGFMVFDQDEELLKALESLEHRKIAIVSFNPTAENIAMFLCNELANICPLVSGITLWETPNCKATYMRDDD